MDLVGTLSCQCRLLCFVRLLFDFFDCLLGYECFGFGCGIAFYGLFLCLCFYYLYCVVMLILLMVLLGVLIGELVLIIC